MNKFDYVSYPKSVGVLTENEIVGIIVGFVNTIKCSTEDMSLLIDTFKMYINHKKGENNALVIEGREIFEALLQADEEWDYFQSYES